MKRVDRDTIEMNTAFYPLLMPTETKEWEFGMITSLASLVNNVALQRADQKDEQVSANTGI
jgi:hypothetical protein